MRITPNSAAGTRKYAFYPTSQQFKSGLTIRVVDTSALCPRAYHLLSSSPIPLPSSDPRRPPFIHFTQVVCAAGLPHQKLHLLLHALHPAAPSPSVKRALHTSSSSPPSPPHLPSASLSLPSSFACTLASTARARPPCSAFASDGRCGWEGAICPPGAERG